MVDTYLRGLFSKRLGEYKQWLSDNVRFHHIELCLQLYKNLDDKQGGTKIYKDIFKWFNNNRSLLYSTAEFETVFNVTKVHIKEEGRKC